MYSNDGKGFDVQLINALSVILFGRLSLEVERLNLGIEILWYKGDFVRGSWTFIYYNGLIPVPKNFRTSYVFIWIV